MSHLNALQVRLSNERGYLAAAKSEKERQMRKVWIAQVEKEIAAEIQFLGAAAPAATEEISDDDLLAALSV